MIERFNILDFYLLFLFFVSLIALALWLIDWLFPPLRRLPDERRHASVDLVRRPGESPLSTVARRSRDPQNGPKSVFAELPPWHAAYWRSTLQLVGPLLIIWFCSFVLPALFANQLNQIVILTGFPLGYYMGAQGSLIIFVLLIVIYCWRMNRLDRRFGVPERAISPHEARFRNRLRTSFGGFVIGFVFLVAVISMIDALFPVPNAWISWFFLLLTIGIYAYIGLRSRTEQLDEYFVAGRRVPGILNGLATGSDWMSAASFISMAGALWLLGYEGLAYISGWTGGFVLLVFLLAPYLRKFGQYTIPDFIGARYPATYTRIVAAVISIIISFTYLTAQVTGVGIIMSRFMGVNYMLGVIFGLAAVLVCSLMGGMRAITWTQTVQGLILVIAYLVPVTWISYQLTGVPLPQLMYGEALHNIAELEAAQGIKSYTEPFNDWSVWNFIALMLCLMLGTAGLPHILIRFYTVPSVRESRSSVGWALVWICVLYFTAPAYAAFARWEVLESVVGRPVAELPIWAESWAGTGLLVIADDPALGGNGDGILQFNELQIDQDLIVLATPEIAGLPHTVVALVAAGGLAAALSTADGLLLVIASAAAHDIYHRTLNPKASVRERLWLGRLMILAAAGLAALTAVQRLAIIAQLVAWAFSLAAATFFPALVLGIFSKRITSKGAVAGMICGLLVTTSYMVVIYLRPEWAILGISSSAAGIFGIPINFVVAWLVSHSDRPPSAETEQLVDHLRIP